MSTGGASCAARWVLLPLVRRSWTRFVPVLGVEPEGCLAFFDDHVSQVHRLWEARELGLRELLFDDDYDLHELLVDKWPAVPTISMCFNSWCHSNESVEWSREGGRLRATWRGAELVRAAEAIESRESLPSLYEQAGFQPGSKMTHVRLKSS